MENNTYKPSNKFNITGFLLIILAVAGAGCLLSALYLKINQINPIVYLTILLTCGFGALLGLISNLIIHKFKIRNAGMALLAVLIGALIFTYFKWALYDYWDYKDVMENMKEKYNVSESDILKIEPEFERTLGGVITSPSTLWNDIKQINEEGRWSYSSSHSSSSTKTPVKGIPLTIVWIFEAGILLLIPMLMANSKAKCPFSETDDEWMTEYKTPFLFGNYDITRNKQLILNNPDEIFNIPYLENLAPRQGYIKGILYHSADYSECYLTLAIQTHNKKNNKYDSANIIKYLKLSYPQVDRLFDHCHLNKPFASTTNYNYQTQYQTPEQNTPMSNGYAQPTYQQPIYQPQQPTQNKSDYVDPDEFFK